MHRREYLQIHSRGYLHLQIHLRGYLYIHGIGYLKIHIRIYLNIYGRIFTHIYQILISFLRNIIENYLFSVQFNLNLKFYRFLPVWQRNITGNSLISLWICKISIFKSTTFSCLLSTIYKLLWLKNTIYKLKTPSVCILQSKFKPNLQYTFIYIPPPKNFLEYDQIRLW